jgi:glycosyltransferase involved in cell wall biosynthesis
MDVSVVMCVRNAEKYLVFCLRSILDQTFREFEVIIIDDLSNDKTKEIIEKFNDKRIRYYRNKQWLGISKSRNLGVKCARGKYLFFTDGDCTVSKNWIEEGLKCLKSPNCVGVEGRIYYVSKNYEPTFADRSMENKSGGCYMTGNIAYKKGVVESVGGFDERLNYLEDRDLALRVMKYGKILFNPKMIVYHPRVILTPKELVQSANRVRNRVRLFKKSGERQFSFWRILLPRDLIRIVFPPLVFLSVFTKKFKTSDDFKLLPFVYIYVINERIELWRECAKERVFLI